MTDRAFLAFLQKDDAPDLPHFGRAFEYHGPAGVLTFRIDMQQRSPGDLIMIMGICLEGEERFETGHVENCEGKLISAWVTEADYMRLSNGP